MIIEQLDVKDWLLFVCFSHYNPYKKLSRQLRKTGVVPVANKQFKTLFKDHIVRFKIISLYVYKDLRLNVTIIIITRMEI